jgi:hypothetical protein
MTTARWPSLCSLNLLLGNLSKMCLGKSGQKNGHFGEIVLGTCGIRNSPDMYQSKKISAMEIVEKCGKETLNATNYANYTV